MVWLARIRRIREYTPSDDMLWAGVDSEAATLQALADSGIAVPRGYPAPMKFRRELTHPPSLLLTM